MTWSIGPKTSSLSWSSEFISKTWGATKLPLSQYSLSSTLAIKVASRVIRSTWASRAYFASMSITGPKSVSRCLGLPPLIEDMAPDSIVSTWSAISCCINRTRRAEQRCPALRNAELITSSTTCSGRAVESTIMQFWPPVSAIKGIGFPGRLANWRLMIKAVAVEPVNAIPAIRGSSMSILPILEPLPKTRCNAWCGTPARWNSFIA